MPYSISKNAKGRFQVTSPAGKTWKATYKTQAAAQKGIDYIVKRSGGTKSAPAGAVSEATMEDELSITPGFAGEA